MILQTVLMIFAVAGTAKSSIPHASISTQYHAQDELGQYSYGYAGGPSAKTETKTADGVVRGEYSYVDANGIIQTAHYVADPYHGFRVIASNDPSGPLAQSATAGHHPVPVSHPAPVAHALPASYPTYEISNIQHVAYQRQPTVYEAGLIPGVDTPEVQIARAAHLHAVAETKARNALINTQAYPSGATYVPYAAAHSHYSYYLPVQVKDTPEVAAAKAAHYAAVNEAKARIEHAQHEAKSRIELAHASHVAQYGYGSYYPYAHAYAYRLPVPVTDTPEVAAAKASHYAAVNEAKIKAHQASYHGNGYYPYVADHSYQLPVQVKDTPEVAAAKAVHYAAVHETKIRDAATANLEAYGNTYLHAPLPVTDTPAVAHAKAHHIAAVHHTKAASGYW